MIIFKKASDINSHIKKIKGKNTSVGFVPTMGALHQGHISLLQNCKQACDIAVCSIFINPTQFNNPDDFKKYPVKTEQDIYLLEKNGCDILFMPPVTEIYPQDKNINVHFELGYLEKILEGKFRPGHFQGVCNVVKKLLDIIEPTHLFLGQKDYQQCMVIKKLLALMNVNINLIISPTTLEESGLAMSSRNLRLDDKQKEQATAIYKTLLFLKEKIQPGDLNILKDEAYEYLMQNNFKIDYIEIAKTDDLKIINEWDGAEKIIALIAATIADVRLIDNMILSN